MIVRRVERPDLGPAGRSLPTHNHHNIMAQKNRMMRPVVRPRNPELSNPDVGFCQHNYRLAPRFLIVNEMFSNGDNENIYGIIKST